MGIFDFFKKKKDVSGNQDSSKTTHDERSQSTSK